MKKFFGKISLLCFVAMMGCLVFSSCKSDYEPDASLLPGTWKEGTVYYKYESS